LPTMTVAKPVVAAVLGITVLGETLHARGANLFLLVVAVALVIAATVALARGEAATMVAEIEADSTSSDKHARPVESPADEDAGPAGDPVVAGDGPTWDGSAEQ
jgi:heme O synthase-like polyprenyltransferase